MKNAVSLAALVAMTGLAHAETTTVETEAGDAAPRLVSAAPSEPVITGLAATDGAVVYAPDFFAEYAPQTALDMVRRVPGFSVESGADRRGFSGTAGNVLIDGARPSAKSQGLQDILGRIPASQVVRLELIRGASGGEAAGQSVLVNVVRTASAGSGRYVADFERSESGRLTQRGELSYNGRVGDLEFTVGAARWLEERPLFGGRLIRDGQDNLIGYRTDATPRTWREAKTNGAIAAPLLGGVFNLNASGGRWTFKTDLESAGFDQFSNPTDSFRLSINERERHREIGGDWERGFGDWTLKLVGLDRRFLYANDESTLSRDDKDRQVEILRQRRRTEVQESIGRASLGWTISRDHRLEFGGESALNVLYAVNNLTVDDGGGPVVIPLQGANATVEEKRFEGFVTHNWKVTPRWALESVVTVETSTISQAGGSHASRSLTFWKPSMQVARQIGERDQIRVQFLRDVSQLDFGDFVSSATLADNTVAAGNPDLRPQATWRLQGTIDKRFGKNGAVALELTREWIEDASDLVPILDTLSGDFFDAPGNIGEGELFGVRLTGTLPLDFILKGAQLKPELSWAESEVTDPVTGNTRQASGFAETEVEIEFRHDISSLKLAYGFEYDKQSEVQFFRVGELETYEEGPFLDGFVETTRFNGMKLRLFAWNLLDPEFHRERRFSNPNRNGAVFHDEERERQFGRFFGIEVSGNF